VNQILTPIEAGLYLNLHFRTISRLAEKGLIPALKVAGRWRFNKAALDSGWVLPVTFEERENSSWMSMSIF
jgi:excisionase family DNA binding protein